MSVVLSLSLSSCLLGRCRNLRGLHDRTLGRRDCLLTRGGLRGRILCQLAADSVRAPKASTSSCTQTYQQPCSPRETVYFLIYLTKTKIVIIFDAHTPIFTMFLFT